MVLVKDLEADVSIDSDLLFQRLLVIASNLRDTKLLDAFQYGLCNYPPSLFESVNLPNKTDKPPLAKEVNNKVNDPQEDSIELFDDTEECPSPTLAILEQYIIPIEIGYPQQKFILDGGSLLYRLKWDRNKTLNEITNYYRNFVTKIYGENIVIVFDGYSDRPSTKDITR